MWFLHVTTRRFKGCSEDNEESRSSLCQKNTPGLMVAEDNEKPYFIQTSIKTVFLLYTAKNQSKSTLNSNYSQNSCLATSIIR